MTIDNDNPVRCVAHRILNFLKRWRSSKEVIRKTLIENVIENTKKWANKEHVESF